MKIFDGVTVNPATLSPTWQGVIGVAMLLANSFAEAEKIRDERVAKAQAQTPRQEPTTLSDVMEQSGLKLPHLHDALTAFMGGSDEAKEAATLIVNTPDPVKLLREFARQYTPGSAANGPIVTPPAAAAPARPVSAAAAASTSATNDATSGSSPQPKLAKFRPEFTREAREAAKQAAGPGPDLPKFRPEFTREGREAAARAAGASAGAETGAVGAAGPGPSVADMLEERLAIITRQADAHQADLHSRIRCAEAELAELEAELEDLRVMAHDRPTLVVVTSTDEDSSPTIATTDADDHIMPAPLDDEAVASEDSSPQIDVSPAPPAADDADGAPAVAPNASADEPAITATPAADEADDAPTVAPHASADDPAIPTAPVQGSAAPVVDEAQPAVGPSPLPSPRSGAEVARAFDMLGKFADQLEARYASDSEQIRSLERKVSVMRGRVEQVRGRSVARRG
jgi:hypothetical protein